MRLENGQYRDVTQVYGEDTFETDFPFPIKFVPYWLAADGEADDEWKKYIGG
ncbi:hypothetical protein GCM10028793_49090 [Nocardiopsis oceani]